MKLVALFGAVSLGAAACAPSSLANPARVSAAGPGLLPPHAAFDDLEHRLLSARSVRVKARLHAEGLVTASISATLLLAGRRLRLDLDGDLEGQPVRGRLTSDGARLAGTGGKKPLATDTPPALAEGMLLGLTRMGLLHNATQVLDGDPPAATDGTARSWLSIGGFTAGPSDAIAFGLAVKGGVASDVTMALDPATRLPRERHMTVHFKGGDMRVTETYEAFAIDDVRDGEL